MNNLITSLNYEYTPFGKELTKIADVVRPLIAKSKVEKLRAHEYDCLVRSLWTVNHLSTKKGHSKLDGGSSVSTDCHNCNFCRKMWEKAMKEIKENGKTNIICAHCYSDTDGKIHRGLANRNMINKEILNVDIPQQSWNEAFQIPIYTMFFRCESFGEADTVQEARNFIRICRAVARIWDLPEAAWSKNSVVWAEGFTLEGKPENMTYVQSSPRINIKTPIAPCIQKWCDHRFTVFDKEYLADHPEIKINCGGRSCAECVKAGKRCYFRDGDFDICEELK